MARNTTRRGRAIYGGKSTLTEDLKDINRDNKRGFGDTWLGDLVGADGKLGVQGPGLRESRRGARRGSDQAPTSSARPQSRPQGEPRVGDTTGQGVSTQEVQVTPLGVGRGDGMAEARRRRREDALIANAEAAIARAEQPATVMGYTWEQYQAGNGLGRLRAGLPAYLTYSEFLELARQERSARATPAPAAPEPTVANGMRTALRQVAGTTGLGRVLDVAERAGTAASESTASTTNTRGRNRSRSGYSKGGLVQKPSGSKNTKTKKATGKTRSGHTDMRKGGLFK